MENTKRIYPATQCICALPPIALKVYMYLLGWQSQETIKLYVKQIAKACKLTEEEVELAIQTLEDVHLIDICKIDQTFCASINAEQTQKYYKIPIAKIMESDGIKMATEVKWNIEEAPKQDIGDMSEQQIQSMILRLQAQLNEKRQVSKMVKNNDVVDDLPW